MGRQRESVIRTWITGCQRDKVEDVNGWEGCLERTERRHRCEAGGRGGGYLQKENSTCKGPEADEGGGIRRESLGPGRMCTDGGQQDWSRWGLSTEPTHWLCPHR